MASEENRAEITKILSPSVSDPNETANARTPDFDCHIDASFMSGLMDRSRDDATPFAQNAIISDYQHRFVDLDNIKNGGNETYLVHLDPAYRRPNVDVDSVWLVDAYLKRNGGTNQVAVRLRNTGEKAAERIIIEFKVENATIASQMVTIEAKSLVTIYFQVINDVKKRILCQVKVDDGAWTFDNIFDFVLTPTAKLPIVLVSDKQIKHPVKTAFDQEEAFQCQLVDDKKGSPDVLRRADLAVLDQESEPNRTLIHTLIETARQGKSLILFISPKWTGGTIDFINNEFQMSALKKIGAVQQNVEMEAPDMKNPFFSNMFERASFGAQLPLVSPNCELAGSNEVLFKTKAGMPVLAEYWIGKGKVYVFSFGLGQDETFSANALFLPVFYRIAEKSSKNRTSSYIRSGDKFLEFECEGCNEENLYSLQNERVKIIPEQKLIGNNVQLYLQDNLSVGFWKICDQQGIEIASFGLNSNKQESEMSFYSLQELKERFARSEQIKVISVEEFIEKIMGIGAKKDPAKFWRYVVAISFLFLLLEIVIARYFKKITVAGA